MSTLSKTNGRETARRKKGLVKEHDFTLVLSGITELTPEVQDGLLEAGCDDATLSICCGRPFLTFSRAAPTLKDAILSAIRDIKKANIGAEVLRIDACNLVNQSEIAHKIGRTRQLVHQYVAGERGPGGFPPPACNVGDDADSPLWYWCDVAHWLYHNNMITEETLRDARALSLINDVLELNYQKKVEPKLTKEVLQHLGSLR